MTDDERPLTLDDMTRINAYHDDCAAVLHLSGWIWEQLEWILFAAEHEEIWGIWTTPLPTQTHREYIATEIEWCDWLRDLEADMWHDIHDTYGHEE